MRYKFLKRTYLRITNVICSYRDQNANKNMKVLKFLF